MEHEDHETTDRFAWHPTYQGQTLSQVRDALRAEIASDQRAHALALAGAELDENAVLASVLALDQKWGAFDLGWAEADAAALAERIAAFEWERERRRDLIDIAAYRAAQLPVGAGDGSADRPWWAFWRP